MIPAFARFYMARPWSSHISTTHTCSRRVVLSAFVSVPAVFLSNYIQLPFVSAVSETMDQHQTEQVIRAYCSPFINSLSLPDPQSDPRFLDLLLWRGSASTPVPQFRRCAPVPDLLDERTYGEQGVVFFQHLEQYMKSSMLPHHQVLPSRSHIATGSRSVASKWGTPVTVWPIGEFKYTFWEAIPLIYTARESVSQTFSKGKQLIIGKCLREAIMAGKEVMFDAPAFFELREDIGRQVISSLLPCNSAIECA